MKLGKYKTVPLASLKEHPSNPRIHGGSAMLAESVDSHGFYGAVVVQKSTMHILAGHARTRLLANSGVDEVPCMVVDVDDETALRILLADNRTGDLAERDCVDLLALMEPMESLEGTGYTDDDLETMRGLLDLPPEGWADAIGSADEKAFWPRLRFTVPTEDYDRFMRLLADEGHDSTVGNLRSLLSRYGGAG